MVLIYKPVNTPSYKPSSTYQPLRSIFLTEKGKLLADYCKKRHEIVYNFLIKIGVNEEVAKNDAEGLEHHVSSETLSVFEKFNKT